MVKNIPVNAGDEGSIPKSGRSPEEGNGNPAPYSCLRNPMDRKNLGSASPRGHKGVGQDGTIENSNAGSVPRGRLCPGPPSFGNENVRRKWRNQKYTGDVKNRHKQQHPQEPCLGLVRKKMLEVGHGCHFISRIAEPPAVWQVSGTSLTPGLQGST